MRVGLWMACMAIAAVMAGAGATSASAATITFSQPVSGIMPPNQCNGEEILFNGTLHIKQTDNSSPTTPIKSQIEMNLTGVTGIGALTGARYIVSDQVSDMLHADPDGGDVQQTFKQSMLVTRQGETGALPIPSDGDDFRLHWLIHFTATNGVPKAQRNELRAECQ